MFPWLKRLRLDAPRAPIEVRGDDLCGTTRVVRSGDFRIELDLSSQVLRLSIPDTVCFHAPLRPSPFLLKLKQPGSSFVSAAVLAQKAKQFDDGLYAAVELAAQQGAGTFLGKRSLLRTIARELRDLPPSSGSSVPGVLFGAAQLGGLDQLTPSRLLSDVESAVARFQANETQSKPISFYTWSEDLRRIFLQDRMLQQELKGAAEIKLLARVLRQAGTRAAYEAYLNLTSRLTNPAPREKPDLRCLLADSETEPPKVPGQGLYFFPPSRAHETELAKKLLGDRLIPAGFNLGEQVILSLRAGSLDVQPRLESGWYDLQTWALEPLILTKKMPEGKRLELDGGYPKKLEQLFKGLLALTRETHIKQLEDAILGAFLPDRPIPTVELVPELSIEPLYSYYLRRAVGYQFVREVLEDVFGAGTLRTLHRITSDGPVKANLHSDLQEISGLFYGASIIAAQELGFTDEERAQMESREISRVPSLSSKGSQELGSANGRAADCELFRRWSEHCEKDADLSRDTRMMVPLFNDLGRRKTKVSVFLGWDSEPLWVSFANKPSTKIFDLHGRPIIPEPHVEFVSRWYSLIYPVTAEIYVEKLLGRKEFQAHCDRYGSMEAILEHLS